MSFPLFLGFLCLIIPLYTQICVLPYVGHKGWIGLWFDIDIDWEMVSNLVRESYRLIAPKRLAAQLV